MIGRQIGVYRVVALLGVGGMGEVYRAHDTKLGRDVALKVLPASFADDGERVARLGREARTLASLNHPRIATIHGYEDADGVCALVMELVEGPTLAERFAASSSSGSRRLSDAIAVAAEIAEALEAAHERGIVHRDLKPANVKLDRDGHVKVLDFGLAQVLVSGEGVDLTRSPTVGATGLGAIVGTPAYMSPEQARGLSADKRTDVWAFGCVLYELLAGRRAFPGETISDTIAAVLERDPDWSALPPGTPSATRRLLRRCLEKDARRRLRDIGDARLELDEAPTPVADEEGSRRPARASRRAVALTAIVTAIVVGGAAVTLELARPARVLPEVRLSVDTPSWRDPSLAFSPDGLQIAFSGREGGRAQLWLRSLGDETAKPLSGTEGATTPFWSPDGRSIGFFTSSALMTMDISGGSARSVAPVSPASDGGTWNSEGVILYSASPGRPILRVSADGGEPSPVTVWDDSVQSRQAGPRFLPDGRHFLYYVGGRPEARGVYVGQLGDLSSRRLFDADSPAVYAASGHLLFNRGGTLLAQRFDADRLEVLGEPFAVAPGLTARAVVSASAAGPIAYRALPADSGQRWLIWVDRKGAELSRVSYEDTASPAPTLSRDGRRVAVARFLDNNMDIRWYDVDRRTWNRATSNPADDILPLWSPDGRYLAFGSNRAIGSGVTPQNLYRMDVRGAPNTEELLLATSDIKFLTDWSPDGGTLLFDNITSRGADIWALPIDTRQPFAVVQTEFSEREAQFSPDGRWIAYQSNKTGRDEIYVRPFRAESGEELVSTGGGTEPRWGAGGSELFYIAADDELMSVPIRGGVSLAPGAPSALFPLEAGEGSSSTRQHYVVAPDGSFMISALPSGGGRSAITVILNWAGTR